MKRVLVAATLGGLLIVGVPSLASSAQRSDSKAERSAASDKGGNKTSADNKGGNDNKGADNKGGNRGNDNKSGDRARQGDRNNRDRDHDGHNRHGHYRGRYGYGYGSGYYYGEPYDCYYGPSGAYNCEPYGGDYGYSGYRDPYGYNYRDDGRNRNGNGNVVVSQMRFNPAETYANPGQEVLWTFKDGNVPHTVTADNKSFDSGQVTEGEFRLVFNQPGTYSYHCAVHPDMKGRVIVGG